MRFTYPIIGRLIADGADAPPIATRWLTFAGSIWVLRFNAPIQFNDTVHL